MQEESTQKSIALVIKAVKLDADILKAAMRMYLNRQKHNPGKNQKSHGKLTVKELVGQGDGVSSIEISDENIKSFERIARKYKVDYSLKKDKTTDPPKYVVFFKGKDTDVISQAFKEYVHDNEKKKEKPSIRQKLKAFSKSISQDKNRERSLEKNKDRGQSL